MALGQTIRHVVETASKTTPNKRQKVSDTRPSILETIERPTRLGSNESIPDLGIAFKLYEKLWDNENAWATIVHEYTEPVPPLDPEEDPDTLPSTKPQTHYVLIDPSFKESFVWTMLGRGFLIRDEYIQLDSFVKETEHKHLLVLGQPGIGKSVYLIYCLLKRLAAGLPTIFSVTPDHRYLFRDSGVYHIPGRSFSGRGVRGVIEDLRDGLVLFDPMVKEEETKGETTTIRTMYSGEIISKYVLKRILNARKYALLDGVERTFNRLFRTPVTRSASGLLFEEAGHSYLWHSRGTQFTIRSLHESGVTGVLSLSHINASIYFKKIEKPDSHQYYQPLSTTLVGIDSLIIEVNDENVPVGIVLFQFTTSLQHPVKTTYLSELWTTIGFQNNWKLVFVVPDGVESDFVEQPWKPTSKADTWHTRIPQYVLGVKTDKLWEPIR